jgi:hypothetical protein
MANDDATPNPGSAEAIERGCSCPRIDNHYGRGVYFDGEYHWWRRADCPLHGTEAEREPIES